MRAGGEMLARKYMLDREAHKERHSCAPPFLVHLLPLHDSGVRYS
jgi:hypothetical protein